MALADYIHNKPVIETDRLVLRPLAYSDIPALKEWMPDKSIYTYWGKCSSQEMAGQTCQRFGESTLGYLFKEYQGYR